MSKYVIVGAGQVGTRLARQLAAAGDDVTVVTRSGSGPTEPGIRCVAADASDPDRLAELAAGSDALFNCANPAYHRWPVDWPPLAASLLTAAERSGAVLVVLGNLYGYGPVDGPMTEDLPLSAPGIKGGIRARMWAEALAAHQAGRVRMVEVRASDYFGPGAGELSHFGASLVPRVLAGKAARFIGDPDAPHSVTYIPDVVDALVTAARDERAWGRAWHVPTSPALTARQFAQLIADEAGARPPRFSVPPHWVLRAAGLVSPLVRELEETRYQFVRPFVVDSSAFETTFGVTPTPMDTAIKDTVSWWRAR